MWEESAPLVRTHDGMNGRMHDHIRRFGQPFDLLGCRRRPWWQGYVVAGIAANHHAAGGGIDAIGHVARNVGRANGTDFYIATGPHDLWLFGSKVIVLINSAGP